MFVYIELTKNRFNYSVYRKPTANQFCIHYYSSHNDVAKRSVFISMFLRALRVVSPMYFDDEISFIYSIGENLKYPRYFIDNCYSIARRTFYSLGRNRDILPLSNVLILPYDPNFVKVKQFLKLLDINLVFSFRSTLKCLLIKNSPKCTDCCIYKIPCSCGKFYVGQTCKTLQTRLKQHKNSVRYGHENSAVFCHLRDNDHPINWQGSKELIFSNDFYSRNILESILIKLTKNENINISSGLFNIDPINEVLICSHFNLSDIVNK